MPSIQTLSYSEQAQGWPSFYSYQPEWMIGMNQYFYTFKDGDLYRHHVNESRNVFYGAAAAASTITGVFNDGPLENKIFKTINLESTDAWAATLETNIQDTGSVEEAWFTKKEQSWHAFVRSDGQTGNLSTEKEWELRSLNGIAQMTSASGPANAYVLQFDKPLGSIISIGDFIYYAVGPGYDTPVFAGVLTAIDNVNLTLTIDSTAETGTTNPIPDATSFIMYIKNPIAESHGILGHYCTFTLSLTTEDPAELFAVETEVMKSFA